MKTIISSLLMVIGLQLFAQNKIVFRPSIALANQLSNKDILTTIKPNNNIAISRNPPTEFLEKWFPPQFGFILEYKHNKQHTVGFGLSECGASNNLQIAILDPITKNITQSSTSSSYASFNKWVLEYGYNFVIPDTKKIYNELTNRFAFTFLMAINHVNIGKNFRGFGGTSVASSFNDTVLISYDSMTSNAVIIQQNFLQLTPGIRIAFKNQKGIEKFGITVSYDYGWKNIIAFNDDSYSINGLKNFSTSQTTNGNQWKVALSIPLTLYDFHKKEHTVGKWFR